jgi:hypothetical protein
MQVIVADCCEELPYGVPARSSRYIELDKVQSIRI